jgi:hypothetical protein
MAHQLKKKTSSEQGDENQEFCLMDQDFKWNPYADQPHNVAPKKDRFWYHFRFIPGYFFLLSSNARMVFPVLSRYRKYNKAMYLTPSQLHHPFGVSVSPSAQRNEEVLNSLKQLGVQNALIRIPSWERNKLDFYKNFVRQIKKEGIDIIISLLQRREDVQNPKTWEQFLDDAFSRLKPFSSLFEIGHAWNRTKWGVWDYREYLRLVEPSVSLAKKHEVKIIGPAVIDFEFHLYPVVLRKIAFDKISSLLYVDRVGAPENAQFGWDTSRKIALLKAVLDACLKENRNIWITEMNWPIAGTGKYSPAVGRMNVSEEEQANFLVRYFVLCLATGFVDRIYWWQLAAPGYGLIDSRPVKWRKRPSFFAMKSMIDRLEGSLFIKKIPHSEVFIFIFCKKKKQFAVCWTQGSSVEHSFSQPISRVESREGEEIPIRENRVRLGPSPKYIYFQ